MPTNLTLRAEVKRITIPKLAMLQSKILALKGIKILKVDIIKVRGT